MSQNSLSSADATQIILSNMLVNAQLALYPIKEARIYGTGVTTTPQELVEQLKNATMKGIPELTASLLGEKKRDHGMELFESLFKVGYEFPNKKAIKIVNSVIDESKRHLPIMTSDATLEGEGPEIGKPTLLTRIGGCAVRCVGCFLATDKIMTTTGMKYLHEVEVGEWLYTFDEDYNLTTTQVTKAIHQMVNPDEFVKVYYEERNQYGKLQTKSKICTQDHEWNVKNVGWVEAKDLKPGSIVHHLNSREVFKQKQSDSNPMHNAETASKVSDAIATQYANGRKPNCMGEDARREASIRMTESNPMYQHASVQRMLLQKEYPKSRAEKITHYVMEKRLKLKVKYTGGGKNKLLIGDNDFGYYMPDFLIKGTNKVLELYSTTYPCYKEDRSSKEGRKLYESSRREHYKRFGYEVEFIRYEDHLPCALDERITKDKISSYPLSTFKILSKRLNKFVTNGVKILSVERLSVREKAGIQRQYDNRKASNDYVSIVNFSCAPFNHFLIDGVHVHNCDTPHSWNAEVAEFDGIIDPTRREYNQVMKVSDVADLIVQQAGYYGLKRVSITGGEPLHYIEALRLLVADLWLRGFYINIETSGTLFDPIVFAMCHVSVDIKTPSSRVELSDTQIGALHAVASYEHASPAHVKAVIKDEVDLNFLKEKFSKILNGNGVYRTLCLTPWAYAVQEDVDPREMSSNIDQITKWVFDHKRELDSRQVRVIAQQHKLMSYV